MHFCTLSFTLHANILAWSPFDITIFLENLKAKTAQFQSQSKGMFYYLPLFVFRHEVPVSCDKIKIIHIDDDLVVVNKPASIPVRIYAYISKTKFYKQPAARLSQTWTTHWDIIKKYWNATQDKPLKWECNNLEWKIARMHLFIALCRNLKCPKKVFINQDYFRLIFFM